MVSTKWDWNEALRVAREDAAEMAREEGMKKGMERGMEKGMEKGRWTTLAELVHKGILSIKEAVQMAGRSEGKFRKLAAL